MDGCGRSTYDELLLVVERDEFAFDFHEVGAVDGLDCEVIAAERPHFFFHAEDDLGWVVKKGTCGLWSECRVEGREVCGYDGRHG